MTKITAAQLLAVQAERIRELEAKLALVFNHQDPPLAIDQRVQLDEFLSARFDGMHIILDTLGSDRVRLTPVGSAMLHWFTGRVVATFADAFVVDVSKVPDGE